MSFEKMQSNIRNSSKTDNFTVLGLLGPAGSGKDVVADWFITKGFVKVAFADPMKRFVLKAFGIETDRLWGPSEKRNEIFQIPDFWWYEAIGHLGDAATEIVNEVLPEGLRVEGYLKLHIWFNNLRKAYTNEISARVILQTLGTEWGRAVDPMMWAKYAHRVVARLRDTPGLGYDQEIGYAVGDPRLIKNPTPSPSKTYRGAIIPDHRFRNEVEFTQENDGYVIRLRRLSMVKTRPDIGVVGHQSETEQKELPDTLFNAVYEFPEGIDKVNYLLESTYEAKPWAREWDRTNELGCTITVRYDDPAVPPA